MSEARPSGAVPAGAGDRAAPGRSRDPEKGAGDGQGKGGRRRGLVTLLIVALMVSNIALIWALAFYGRDEWKAMQVADDDDRPQAADDDDEHVAAPSRAAQDRGEPVVWLPQAAQEASGIVTAPVVAGTGAAERMAWATVLDTQPLIDARARHDGAVAEARAAEAAIARTTGELKRLRALFADDRNVSASTVESAQSQLRAEEARLAQSRSARMAALEGVRAQWGEAVAEAFAEPAGDGLLARLLRREQVLLQVSLPAAAARVPPGDIRVDGQPARLVGPAVRGDPQFGGPTFLFSAASGGLRAGARVAVSLPGPGPGSAGDGVVVPHEAAVWHGGRAWAYVVSGDGQRGTRFARRWVETREEVAAGWINRERFAAGDRVVVEGAQLLLSEELRFQVRTDD